MWTILLDVGGVILGVAGGLLLGLWAKRRLEKSKGARAGAMLALAFMGMFNFIPPERRPFRSRPRK
jgi:hypothetical protein